MTEVLLSTEFDRVLVNVGPYEKEFKIFVDKFETLEVFREAKSYFAFPGMYSILSLNEVEQLLKTFTKVESSTLNTRLSSLKVAS